MMKLILIRHAEVDFEWPKKCSSREFDDACKRYDTAGIRTDGVKPAKGKGYCIITSSQDRTKETARLMFGKAPVIESDLFDEVPLVSFRDTEKRLPKWLFDVMGRLQWLFGSERQPESRRQTIDRAKKAVALIDRQGSDCVVISHGFFMRSLLRVYARGKGYTVTRSTYFTIPPLSRIRITMAKDHCGNCAHNCLLENPGCQIGRMKAQQWSAGWKKGSYQ